MFLEKLVTRKLEQMNVTHGIHTAFEYVAIVSFTYSPSDHYSSNILQMPCEELLGPSNHRILRVPPQCQSFCRRMFHDELYVQNPSAPNTL